MILEDIESYKNKRLTDLGDGLTDSRRRTCRFEGFCEGFWGHLVLLAEEIDGALSSLNSLGFVEERGRV